MQNVISFRRMRRPVASVRSIADHPDHLVQPASPPPVAAARSVLSVGHMDDGTLLPETLNHPPELSFSHVRDFRDLWAISKAISFDAVLFQESLGHFELEEAARLVRRRWPSARILLIRPGGIALEDHLYDQRLKPPVDPDTLTAILSEKIHPIRQEPRLRWRMAIASPGL